jgi:hypothetical protein
MRQPLVKRHTCPKSGLFTFFPHSSAWAVDRRSHVLTEFLDTGAASVWLHHTRIEVLSSLAGRLPKPSVLGDLETSPYPPTGLCKRVAERVPFASECQARERGSTQEPLATCTAGNEGRCIPCSHLLPSLPLSTIADQQICWRGGLIHYHRPAGDGLQRPLCSRCPPRLTPGERARWARCTVSMTSRYATFPSVLIPEHPTASVVLGTHRGHAGGQLTPSPAWQRCLLLAHPQTSQ